MILLRQELELVSVGRSNHAATTVLLPRKTLAAAEGLETQSRQHRGSIG